MALLLLTKNELEVVPILYHPVAGFEQSYLESLIPLNSNDTPPP
jgi:hypothetical protein